VSRTLITIKRTALELGPELGHGGEGTVYRVRNRSDLAVKLYHPSRASTELQRKLRVMVGLANDHLTTHAAWPVDLIDNGSFGVVMPLIGKSLEIHDVYGPKSRMAKLPQAGFKFLLLVAYNLCAAVKHIHAAGVVVGDFNQRNILVSNDARVCFVDCDSFQVRLGNELFRCTVATPDQLAPEVHNRPLDQIIRECDHDNFTLAVIIFQLLFVGRHPFAGVGGPDELPLAITRHLYAYGARAVKAGIRPPPHAPQIDLLPPNLAKLFERAFAPPAERLARPTPDEWGRELKYSLDHVVQCRTNRTHEFVAGRMTCPWCDLEDKFSLTFFVSTVPVLNFTGVGNFHGVVQQLSQVPAPRWSGRLTARWAGPAPVPPANATRWPGSYWFGLGLLAVAAWALGTGHWFIALLIAGWGLQIALSGLSGSDPRVTAAENALKDAERQRQEAETEIRKWIAAVGEEFARRKSRLQQLRTQYDGLGAKRTKRIEVLRNQHEKLQLEQYLDQFYIIHASIPGFGSRRKDMLLSYGIETARDVHSDMGVPGVGWDLEQRLIAWRAAHEQNFRFNPATQIDVREIQKIDVAIATEKQDLERKLAGLKDEIEQAVRKADKDLQARTSLYETADDELARREAEIAALKQIASSTPNAGPKVLLGIWVVVLLGVVAAVNAPPSSTVVSGPTAPLPSVAAPSAPSVGKIATHLAAPAELELYRQNANGWELMQRRSMTEQSSSFEGISAGSYRLLARAVGWRFPQQADVSVKAGQPVEVNFTFTRANLTIDSIPRGAAVFEENTFLGTTPFQLHDVTTEKHTFAFRHAGLPDRTIEANVTPDFQRVMQVWPVGTIKLRSDPLGAEVRQGERVLGRTPLTVTELVAGDYEFNLSLNGYEPTTVRGRVNGDETVPLNVGLSQISPLRLTAEFVRNGKAITIVNRSNRPANLQKITLTHRNGTPLSEFRDVGMLAAGENKVIAASAALPPDVHVEIECENAPVRLEIVQSEQSSITASADAFPPRSIEVRLDRASQSLRFYHRGQTSLTIRRVELELQPGGRKRTIEVNRPLAPGATLRVSLRTQRDENYSFIVRTDPQVPEGTLVFDPGN